MNADGKRLFVLDTNVLMHDPAALFRFHEHDVYLPMVVLEELDRAKKGVSEIARNVRQVSRFLDDMINSIAARDMDKGIQLPGPDPAADTAQISGRLFFQTHAVAEALPDSLPGHTPDNSILGMALSLQNSAAKLPVTLVSKDINLRIKARLLGINAEDYYNDQVVEDADLIYTGLEELPDDFWKTRTDAIQCIQDQDGTRYLLPEQTTAAWYPNQCLTIGGDEPLDLLVRDSEEHGVSLEVAHNFASSSHKVWGINARNREQNFALNLLMDPDIDFVSLLGTAGTGKTLLALAAGLVQVLDDKRYREIIMTRVTVPVAEDIGFLPGTEEEKMTPWMGALMDNLEVLTQPENGDEWGMAATADLLSKRIKIRSLNFMRGRTFLNRYLIIDEAQNLTSKQMKTLITRAGPGTKLICLGNVGQIDTPYLTETTSGITFAVDRFKAWRHSGHITLRRGERSRLADYASKNL